MNIGLNDVDIEAYDSSYVTYALDRVLGHLTVPMTPF